MNICFLDYETYWSVDHSLTKMNPIDYVMHPETEIQSLSIKWNDYPTDVFFGEDRIAKVMEQHKNDFKDAMIVAHNGSGFDHLISAWRFGVKPKAWGCTLAMARPFYGLSVGGSLKKVSEAMNLGVKGSLEATNTKGKKLKDFTPAEIAAMREYNRQDTELCAGIFRGLAPLLTTKEMKLIDLTCRMTVEPKLLADTGLLQRTLTQVQATKRERLLELAKIVREIPLAPNSEVLSGVDSFAYSEEDLANVMKKMLMSQSLFAMLLEKLGAPVPLKPSTTTPGKMIPALAKTDKGMEQLLESDDDRVALAAAVRMESKSTQLETRLQTYLSVADAMGDGYMPMPLNYCGALISWRMSGAMKMNVQNMPRVERHPKSHPLAGKPTDKPGNALRLSLTAPPGKMIVVVDSSNIELRVAHKLAGQEDTVEKLRNKEDLYCWFASMLFGRTITKADEAERFIGKVAMLSLQYGASWSSFQNMARVLSGGKSRLSEDECKRIVSVWRYTFPQISDKKNGIWAKCNAAIDAMYSGNTFVFSELALYTAHERLVTPAGHWLQYADLRKHTSQSTGREEWLYGNGRNQSRIYGAMLFENICISGDVEVLTTSGWKRTIDVSAQDRVWDGIEWVSHDGLVAKGVKRTINFGGAWMTPDHEVLVNGDWIEAQHTTHKEATASFRKAWHVPASSVRCVSFYAGQMQPANASGVPQLRRAWHHSLREMAGVVRIILGGHGRLVQAGAYAGPQEEQPGVQQNELRVGVIQAAGTQPPQQLLHHDPVRATSRAGSAGSFGASPYYSVVQSLMLAGSGLVQEAGQEKIESRKEPVYDLVNAGPRHRFTVRGSDGRPFIVHNCQHIARNIVMEQTLVLDKMYPDSAALSCHDEGVLVVDEDLAEQCAEDAERIFSTAPVWWPDLPLAAETGIGRTYGDAK